MRKLTPKIKEKIIKKKFTFKELFPNMDQNKFSFSSLSLYESCPYCWYLQYVVGIKPKQISDNLVFGSVVHKILEYEDVDLSQAELHKLIDETIVREIGGKELKKSSPAKLKSDALATYELIKKSPIMREDGSQLTLKEKEVEIYVPVGPFVLHSKIDGISDRNEIVEHKTSSIKYTIPLIESSRQHVLYEISSRHENGLPSNGVIYDIIYKGKEPYREQILIKVTEEDITSAKQWIIELATHIKHKDWTPYHEIDRKHLGYCEYKNLCPYCSGEKQI